MYICYSAEFKKSKIEFDSLLESPTIIVSGDITIPIINENNDYSKFNINISEIA